MAEKTTVLDYLKWRGDLTLAQDAFNEVDNLVLCILAYLNYRRFPQLALRDPEQAVPLREINALMGDQDEQLGLSELSYLPVMRLASDSRRFGDIRMLGYEYEWDEEKETQFQAISFLLPDKTLFIAYMGTDRSLTGWKEDFNMSFLLEVPAQRRAAAYAADMAALCPEYSLRLGGHSKGGNLAAWAAIHLPQPVQETRLLAIYNNDGPGFHSEVTQTDAYRRISGKLYTFVPESSIVGVLLTHPEDYTVIDSTNRSILQHEAMSWCCSGPQFVHLGGRSQWGQLSDDVVRSWVDSLSPREREEFCDALFELLSKGGQVQTLDDLRSEGFSGLRELLRDYNRSDEKTRQIISRVLRRLAADVGTELKRVAGQELTDAREAIEAAGRGLLSRGSNRGTAPRAPEEEK